MLNGGAFQGVKHLLEERFLCSLIRLARSIIAKNASRWQTQRDEVRNLQLELVAIRVDLHTICFLHHVLLFYNI